MRDRCCKSPSPTGCVWPADPGQYYRETGKVAERQKRSRGWGEVAILPLGIIVQRGAGLGSPANLVVSTEFRRPSHAPPPRLRKPGDQKALQQALASIRQRRVHLHHGSGHSSALPDPGDRSKGLAETRSVASLGACHAGCLHQESAPYRTSSSFISLPVQPASFGQRMPTKRHLFYTECRK